MDFYLTEIVCKLILAFWQCQQSQISLNFLGHPVQSMTRQLTVADRSGPFQQFWPCSYFISEYLLSAGPVHTPHVLKYQHISQLFLPPVCNNIFMSSVRHSKPHPVPHCSVLSHGKFNSMITGPESILRKFHNDMITNIIMLQTHHKLSPAVCVFTMLCNLCK